MLSKKIETALNEQIQKELFSEYQYLAMAAYCADEDLAGFENFFMVHTQEERFHAMKIYRYILDRGGKVSLRPLEKPQNEFSSLIEAFEIALSHEEFVSKSINELVDLAIEEKDHATRSFLNWFVDEQVEEEDLFSTVLNKLKLVKGDGHGILMLDEEYAARTFSGEEE
ncbi:ferritin [Chitinivibrio alkaliphilus]|uniref:Ferritin n=1 Tax=Chitinivibrio alkaliphilus ACht1 TaxID=1313304 RepID=U7DBB5_9BACT|nr:ferritin [Chitinivibrio alkaliphilus]ERP31715.1 Ferroxidase [Chitinivibrio alkaliphilus ACht1]